MIPRPRTRLQLRPPTYRGQGRCADAEALGGIPYSLRRRFSPVVYAPNLEMRHQRARHRRGRPARRWHAPTFDHTTREGHMSVADRRARFHELHAREGIFVMPNPWDAGSARLLEQCGFEALATTSAGYAWLLGREDHAVTRDELVAHVAELAAAVDVPLSVDSERCFAGDPAGVAETVRLLAGAGAAGCSIEDWDQENGRIDDPGHATELVTAAVEAAHQGEAPLVLTARAENHLHG